MKVNGTIVILDQKRTLFDFLQTQGLDLNAIAVEHNGEIIPKATYKNVLLDDHDTLEIVRFVGGG